MTAITKKDQYLEETIELSRRLSEGFISLGERLYKIYSEEIWKVGRYDSYEEFLEDLGMSPAQASKIRQIYEHYVLKLGYTDREKLSVVPWSSLYSAISITKDKDAVETLVSDVEKKITRRQDIEERSRIAKHGECERHSWVKIRFCEKCNKREKIMDS